MVALILDGIYEYDVDERYPTLCSISLACRSWRRLSQERLVREVVLASKTERDMHDMLRTIVCARSVRIIRCDERAGKCCGADIEDISFARCLGLLELHLCTGFMLRSLTTTHLPSTLVNLSLVFSMDDRIAFFGTLPNLRRLDLYDHISDEDPHEAATLISSTQTSSRFPALVHLHLVVSSSFAFRAWRIVEASQCSLKSARLSQMYASEVAFLFGRECCQVLEEVDMDVSWSDDLFSNVELSRTLRKLAMKVTLKHEGEARAFGTVMLSLLTKGQLEGACVIFKTCSYRQEAREAAIELAHAGASSSIGLSEVAVQCCQESLFARRCARVRSFPLYRPRTSPMLYSAERRTPCYSGISRVMKARTPREVWRRHFGSSTCTHSCRYSSCVAADQRGPNLRLLLPDRAQRASTQYTTTRSRSSASHGHSNILLCVQKCPTSHPAVSGELTTVQAANSHPAGSARVFRISELVEAMSDDIYDFDIPVRYAATRRFDPSP